MQESHALKYFVPSWPALVMGTGGLANILWKWQSEVAFTRYIAFVLAAIAAIGYVIIMCTKLIRLSKYRAYAARDLHDPVVSNFYVTTGVSTIIFATNIANIWSLWIPEQAVYYICLIMWAVASAIVTYCTFYITLRNFLFEGKFQPQQINFAWLMAPIANMAILLIGCPVTNMSAKFQPGATMTLFTMNTAFFGIGFFLFIFVSSYVYGRYMEAEISAPATTPTFGIFLSAIGLIAGPLYDLSNTAKNMGLLESSGTAHLLCAITWGFGIWILFLTILICLHHARTTEMMFRLGWWAFIFPLAAYTIASLKIRDAYPCAFTTIYAVFLTLLLAGLWIYVFLKTMLGVFDGSIFMGTPIEEAAE